MKKTLVIGASLKPWRYSNQALKRLDEKGVDAVGLGSEAGSAYGIRVAAEPEAFPGIHTISLYLNPGRQREYYEYIINLHPSRVIFNPGTENPEFQAQLGATGIEVLEACTLVLLITGAY